MGRDKKNLQFNLRLTAADKSRLEKNSSKAGITASEYVRKCIRNQTPATREDFMMMKSLINEINAIGNNLNQIARNFNSGFFDESEKKQLISLMEELIKNTGEIIKGSTAGRGD